MICPHCKRKTRVLRSRFAHAPVQALNRRGAREKFWTLATPAGTFERMRLGDKTCFKRQISSVYRDSMRRIDPQGPSLRNVVR
jgi:hypothetical protein